jgi:hypothetical protein
MKVSVDKISFKIVVVFQDSDVDLVLREMKARGVSTPASLPLGNSVDAIVIDDEVLSKTPAEASVKFCLQWLSGFVNRNKMEIINSKWDKDFSKEPITVIHPEGFEYTTWPKVKTELEEIGLEVESTYGLMQGSCHLVCSVARDEFSDELIANAQKIVNEVFEKYVVYFQPQGQA